MGGRCTRVGGGWVEGSQFVRGNPRCEVEEQFGLRAQCTRGGRALRVNTAGTSPARALQ